MPRAKKWALRLAMVILGPLLLLLLIEAVWQCVGDPRIAQDQAFLKTRPPHFRLGQLGVLSYDPDPTIAYTLTPGFKETIEGKVYRINEHGMRGGPVSLAKPEGVQRVVIIGDSFAFGFGVAERDTMGAQLESVLNAAGHKVEVLNQGVPSFQTGQEAALFQRSGVRFAPDLVILVYYANDNTSLVLNYHEGLHILYADELPLPRALKRGMDWSILYAKLTAGYTKYLSRSGALDAVGPLHWGSTSGSIRAIAETCAKHGARFAIVAIPLLDNSTGFVNLQHPNNIAHDRVLAFAAAQKIPTVDLREILIRRGKPIEELFVSYTPKPIDSHLDKVGYALIVTALADLIAQQRLLEPVK